MSQNETPTPRRDDDFAAKLFAEWAKSHVSGLTHQEIEEVRRVIELRKRITWVVGGLKTWAIWVTALIAAWTIGIDSIKQVLKSLISS